MKKNKLTWIMIGAALAGAACDPVRTQEYTGNYPTPIRIDMSQVSNQVAAVSRPSGVGAGVSTWLYQPLRRWDYRAVSYGFSGLSTSPTGDVLPDSLELWREMSRLLDSASHLEPITTPLDGPALVTGTLQVDVSPISGSSGGPSFRAADPDHVLVAATAEMDFAPIGPAGPMVHVTPGFHIFQRSCTPDGTQAFAEVPLDTALRPTEVPPDVESQPRQAPWDFSNLLPDPIIAGCGIDVGATVDLGTVAAPLPPDYVTGKADKLDLLQVTGLAWQPDSAGFYILAQRSKAAMAAPMPAPSARLLHLALGEPAPTVITTDDLSAPLSLATGGTSALLWARRAMAWQYTQQALPGSSLPLQTQLPTSSTDPTEPAMTALSTDGNILAAPGPTFVDLRTGGSSAFTIPTPDTGRYPSPLDTAAAAWSPDGTQLLLGMWLDWGSDEPRTYAIVPLTYTGSLPTAIGALQPLPSDGLPAALAANATRWPYDSSRANVRFFWSTSGPQALIQDVEGTRVYDFTTQQQTPLVEPARAPLPSAPIDVVPQAGEAFAWAVQCFGLGETSCRAELRRLSLATGAVDVVATADQPRVFAVSPDGTRIAFADDTNIYVKTIPAPTPRSP